MAQLATEHLFLNMEDKPKPCTVCNAASRDGLHKAQKKYLQILHVLIEKDIPNYSELGSLHLCAICEGKIRDYSDLCMQVQQSKTSLLEAVQKSMKARQTDKKFVETTEETRLVNLEIIAIKKEHVKEELFEDEREKVEETSLRRSLRRSGKQPSPKTVEGAKSFNDTDLDNEAFEELMEDCNESMDDYLPSDTDEKPDLDQELKEQSEDNRKFACLNADCGAVFDTHRELTRHQNQVHKRRSKSMSASSKDGGPFACTEDDCDAIFATRNQLKKHRRAHCIEKLTCNVCQKRFNRPLQVEIHAQTHRGIPETQCTICDKMCPSVMSLYNHRLAHNAPLRHMCEVCGKGFKTNVALRRHSLFHADIKPYKCDQCSKQFRTPGELKNHAFRHTGVKPLACHLCTRRYVAMSSLNLHIAEYHEKRPPKTLHYCRLCEGETVAFDRVSLLNKHMVRKHNTELEIQNWRRNKKKQDLEKQADVGKQLEEHLQEIIDGKNQ